MKRREFIKGFGMMAITPFMPSIPINLNSAEINPTGYEMFMENIFGMICRQAQIPEAVLRLELNEGYSLSKEVLCREWNERRRTKVKITSIY